MRVSDIVSDAHGACEDRAIFEREIVKVNPRRVSRVKKEVLGVTFVGERVFLCGSRNSDARNNKGI
jgi:hypothetical protein